MSNLKTRLGWTMSLALGAALIASGCDNQAGDDPAMAPAGDSTLGPAGDAMSPAGDPAMDPMGDPAMPGGDAMPAPGGFGAQPDPAYDTTPADQTFPDPVDPPADEPFPVDPPADEPAPTDDPEVPVEPEPSEPDDDTNA